MACALINPKAVCKMKARRTLVVIVSAVSLLLLISCREDMHNQPKFIPLRENTFYPDERSARPTIPGTIARGQLQDDPLLYTGKLNGQEADQFPFAMTENDLERGRERFNIFCSPCHSQLGDGNGMIVQRGLKKPPSYFEPRLLKAPVGHFFYVMTNGWGAMADYSDQVPVADRWRIAAYIRALQLSHPAKSGELQTAHHAANQVPEQSSGEVKSAEPVRERKVEGTVIHKEAK